MTRARIRNVVNLVNLAIVLTPIWFAGVLSADQIPVRRPEGLIHGFLELRDLQNVVLASGELSQVTNGAQVTSDLILHFKDGSTHEEITVFSQRRVFQLISYREIQKGPSFKRPMDMSINAAVGEVKIRYTDEDGKEKTIDDHMKIPPDLANGMVTTLLNDVDPKADKTTLSMIVSTPKPRLVKLVITPDGQEAYAVAGKSHEAAQYRIKIDITGIAGVIAPIVGKQPPDTLIWMSTGKAPGFLRSQGPQFDGGPIWRIQLASPVWPNGGDTASR